MEQSIPDNWRLAVIGILAEGDRDCIGWSARALRDWNSTSNWEPPYIAQEAIRRTLEVRGVIGKSVTLMDGETWAFWFYWEGRKLYGKISLLSSGLAIDIISGSFVFSVEWNSREGRDFKFACDKIEHGDKVSIGSIPSGFTLGSREDAAEAF